MSNPNPSVSNSSQQAPIQFPSLTALRATHSELLKRHRELGNTPELLHEIKTFIDQGRALGALLDRDEDRWASQSLLDYWSAIVYRAGQEPPDATLLAFDPSLAPELDERLCPYLGLEAFHENNHKLFYGRQRLLEQLLNHLRENRLLAVVGPSGSGKSSVVLGGLLPALQAGALPGSETWRYYPPIVPGTDPLAALAHRLKPSHVNTIEWTQRQIDHLLKNPSHLVQLVNELGSNTAVLVVDQFEEVFTLCSSEQVRQGFIDNLIALVQSPGERHRVILTMRTDFESQVARLANFKPLFEQAQVRVTAMDASELREAIEKPAALVGLKFEEGLVDALLQDVLGEPAALPLLQFTLLKLWDHRERSLVTWETYKRLGGGRLALARTADEFFNALIPEEQITAKRILLKMVRPSEGLEVTNNRIQRQALYRSGEAHDRIDRVLNKLIQARLIRLTTGDTPTDDQVEVAHEALIRNWPRLVDWLEDERTTMRHRLRLTIAAEQWQTQGRHRTALLRGVLLNEALSYEDLNELETEFVRQSKKAAQQDRHIVMAVQVIMLLTLSLGLLLVKQWTTSQELDKTGRLRLAALNLFERVDATNMLLALDAKTGLASAIAAVGDSLELGQVLSPVENNLRRALRGIFPEFRSAIFVAYTFDNHYMVTTRQDRIAQVWNLVAGPEPQLTISLGKVKSDIIGIALSSDEQFIFTTGKNGNWKLWNRKGQLLHESLLNRDFATAIAFSPNGQFVVCGSRDGTIEVWQWQTEKRIRLFDQEAASDYVTSVAISPDNQLIASGYANGAIRIWDLNGNLIKRFPNPEGYVVSLTLTPEVLISSSTTGKPYQWNRRDWSPIDKPIKVQAEPWKILLKLGCNQLRNDPLFNPPKESVTRKARETCEAYIWNPGS